MQNSCPSTRLRGHISLENCATKKSSRFHLIRLVSRKQVTDRTKLTDPLHQRLWMADRRKRHGLHDHDTCILCGRAVETCDHLLAGYVLARQL